MLLTTLANLPSVRHGAHIPQGRTCSDYSKSKSESVSPRGDYGGDFPKLNTAVSCN
jgi:hypothetical protein